MRAIRRFTVRPVLPEPLHGLNALAVNLRWSWHPDTQDLFASVDPKLWESSGHDPVRMIGSVPAERLAELAADKVFLARLAQATGNLDTYLTEDRWYQKLGDSAPSTIAYFSPEFGITAVLPQYSGGLGILAGDHLKAASDLGTPIIGVGLLYRHGYFRQSFSRDGWQQEQYPVLDPDGLPISALRDENGEHVRLQVGLPGGETLHARIWVAQVGRVPLLLLDSDVEENSPVVRDVTDRLYGGNSEHRLRQEMLLGIGGVRAIRAYCALSGRAAPEVFHTNEGHAGFLGIERIREMTEQQGLDFQTAVEVARAGTVFTTHTPVPAGIDRFPRTLVEQYFGGDNGSPGVPVDKLLALGAEDYDGGDPSVFNMAVMGLRLAQRANGVSELHGEVSREMFGGLWPAFDPKERPIGSITNGVHAPTWVAREVFALAAAQGVDVEHDAPSEIFEAADKVPADQIWATKRILRERLVKDARKRLKKSWLQRGAAEAELGWVDTVLDPDVLTIGFARRAASYKRLTLMLSDPERLKSLLLHPTRPVQLIMAGKAHPADDGGKKLIQAIVALGDDPDLRQRIVYLPNYDIAMAQPLYPGCDVWLNNPLRPYEACGTSGMKAALNGGLNLSILDGWWDEWFDGSNGWAIPSADGVDDPDRRDDLEAAALYDLIENDVAAKFYDHDAAGIPQRWIEMVRHTLKSLGPKVIADRMVQDYVRQLYVPAADSARTLNGSFDGAKGLADWKAHIREAWPNVKIDHVDSHGVGDSPEVGAQMSLSAFVSLGDLSPEDVDVQVVHGRVRDEDDLVDPVVAPLAHAEAYEAGRHRYEGVIPFSKTGPFGYTVRVVPRNNHLASVAELLLGDDARGLILGFDALVAWIRRLTQAQLAQPGRLITLARTSRSVLASHFRVSLHCMGIKRAVVAGVVGLGLAVSGALVVEGPAQARGKAYVVTAKVSTTQLVSGNKVHIKGTVKPFKKGDPVNLQVKHDNETKWKTIDSMALSGKGKYDFTDKPSTIRARKYRVVKPASPNHAKGVSKALLVTVYQWTKLANLGFREQVSTGYAGSVDINAVTYTDAIAGSFYANSGHGDWNLKRECLKFQGRVGITDDSDVNAGATISLESDAVANYSHAFGLGESTYVTFDLTGVFRLDFVWTVTNPDDETAPITGAVPTLAGGRVLCSF